MTRERMPEQGSWRAVGYLRVSTETQAEHETHEGQRHAIEGYCAERGYAIVGWYQDLGVSGRAVPFAQRDGGAALMRELGADGGDGDASTQGDLARREVAAKQSENDALGVAQACVSGHVPPPRQRARWVEGASMRCCAIRWRWLRHAARGS